MKFIRYADTAAFGANTLDILLENEAQNNLPISFILNERGFDTSNWLMAAVMDASGAVALAAACRRGQPDLQRHLPQDRLCGSMHS